jgi:hypothetical protein
MGSKGSTIQGFGLNDVGDVSQPLRSILYGWFNQEHHLDVDGIVSYEILDNLDKIKI